MTHILTPSIPGKPVFSGPAYSFLIANGTRKILFDLGIRKDYATGYAPAVCARINDPSRGFKVWWAGGEEEARDVADVLTRGGVELGEIEAVVWSHHHWDHTGNVSRFPGSTDLVVGPGFKDAFGEGWPKVEGSGVRGDDWEGRELREVAFDDGLKIGRLRAVDWFGDGSFYLLDTPGHAVGHVCGLARVKEGEGEAFVFMGGDCAHHPGEFRPSPYLPIPANISPSPLPHHHAYATVCPGALFDTVHPANDPVAKRTEPFYAPTKSFPFDYDQCMWSIEGMQEFDADERVLVVNAHDETLLGLFEGEGQGQEKGWMWPNGRSLNQWREAALGKKGKWRFLGDFAEGVEAGKP